MTTEHKSLEEIAREAAVSLFYLHLDLQNVEQVILAALQSVAPEHARLEKELTEANTRYEKLRAAVNGMLPKELEHLEALTADKLRLENEIEMLRNLNH